MSNRRLLAALAALTVVAVLTVVAALAARAGSPAPGPTLTARVTATSVPATGESTDVSVRFTVTRLPPGSNLSFSMAGPVPPPPGGCSRVPEVAFDAVGTAPSESGSRPLPPSAKGTITVYGIVSRPGCYGWGAAAGPIGTASVVSPYGSPGAWFRVTP